MHRGSGWAINGFNIEMASYRGSDVHKIFKDGYNEVVPYNFNVNLFVKV